MINKKNKIIIAISIIIAVMLFALIYYYKNNSNNINPVKNDSIFDSKIDTNANFKDSDHSDNFQYTAKITVDNSRITNGLVPMQYVIEIIPKTSLVYHNVVATIFLNENMHNWIVTDSILYFGTALSSKITIGDKNNTGLNVGKTTWIKEGYNKKKLEQDLGLPLKIKVSWQDNVEYVTLSHIVVQFK